ncbi:MAG: HAMP domain-containing sensor histidine kinase [Lachnospiraceae bacterium]|nr:HAMP domain-containing sensor histidine kinase [Lachnospiraceae bacterium]
MAWLMIGILIGIIGILLFCLWNVTKEVYQFADKLEKNLDAMIVGMEPSSLDECEESLWGKISEKLHRVEQIWKQKEVESLEEKQNIKELISDISHQTKTPIANLEIYTELLGQEMMSEQGHVFLSDIKMQIEKLDFLMESMVKMSRLETGIIQIQKEKTDLRGTLAKAVAAIVPKAEKKQIQVYVNCEKEIKIPHDRKWTEEAIFNVLDNAVKYTPRHGKIEISVHYQEIFTKISIKDNGKGIPMNRQAEIFKRFYREPEVHEIEGIGVGLYLTRKILELQKGYIQVQSKENSGANFLLFFPNEDA